jgi:dUTPase
MMSSQILWQFKKGDKIAQLLLLPYISINSSDGMWTDGFGSTDQKLSLWTSIISEYT